MTDGQDAGVYLSQALELIKARVLELEASLEEGQREVEDMHDYYWQNYTEMDEYGYENYDNQQALLRQINANQEGLLLRRRLLKMLDAPFFGRVDFCFEGEEEPERFYIGIGNFARRAGDVPLIYDWRSPVSSLFYDYDRGPASYQAPGGRLVGEITAKWQYKIRRGRLEYAFESDVKIDDEILKAELGGSGEARLKSIIRTIQKEQNAIIRNTRDRILAIQGAAGSGKTSVALHRIAYLLYHDRKNLKSSNILVLSPNGVFSDYISHILPELGEENIQETTFDLFAYRQLRDTAADCEDRCGQMEKKLSGEEDAYAARKESQEFLEELEGFVLGLEDELMSFRDVEYAKVTRRAEELLPLFYEKLGEIPLLSRMDAVAEGFIDEAETLKGRDFSLGEREEIRNRFRSMYETRDLYLLYNRFLKRMGYPTLPELPLEERILPYQDVYPVLYLKYRLERQQERTGIKHVVVDEMQDYSQLQYRILRQMFSCPMTLLGDRAQTMGEEPRDVLSFLPKIFGRDLRRIEMKKSYRNTLEISRYANELAGITGNELFARHGKPVEKKRVRDLTEALEQVIRELRLGEEGYETAAVITAAQEEADRAYAWLKDWGMERISLLGRDSESFHTGLTVTTFYLAKGLEFDQVFSVFHEQDVRPLLIQARYIAATRALHELWVCELEV